MSTLDGSVERVGSALAGSGASREVRDFLPRQTRGSSRVLSISSPPRGCSELHARGAVFHCTCRTLSDVHVHVPVHCTRCTHATRTLRARSEHAAIAHHVCTAQARLTSPRQAGWNQFNQEYLRLRVELENKELEYHISRLNSITVAGSVIAGFAFTALVELTISVDMVDKLRASGYYYLEFIYYLAIGSTIALNLFVIVISTMVNIKGQRMALFGSVDASVMQSELPANLGYRPGMLGEHAEAAAAEEALGHAGAQGGRLGANESASFDDVQRAIMAMRAVQPSIFAAFGLSLCTFVVGAIAMVWIKTEPIHFLRGGKGDPNHIAFALSVVFVGLLVVMAIAFGWINRLFRVRYYNDASLRNRYSESADEPNLYTPPQRTPPAPTSWG